MYDKVLGNIILVVKSLYQKVALCRENGAF